jgi:hypothetical protein
MVGVLQLDGGAVDSHGVEELLHLLGHGHVVAHRAAHNKASTKCHGDQMYKGTKCFVSPCTFGFIFVEMSGSSSWFKSLLDISTS